MLALISNTMKQTFQDHSQVMSSVGDLMEKQVAAAMSCGATMNQQDGEHRGGRGGEQFFICSPSAPMMCFFLPHLPTFISAPPAESFARTTREQLIV